MPQHGPHPEKNKSAKPVVQNNSSLPSALPSSTSSPQKQPLEAQAKMVRFAPVIATVSTLALMVCLIGHFSTVIIDFARTKDIIEASKNVVEMGAVAAGGVWAYFKFVKGRTFKESLTPAVSGRFASIDGVIYLIATTQIKNVGLSKIEFDREGSALILFEYNPSSQNEIHTVADNRLTSFEVFSEKDRYIEPNEIIDGQRFIAVPGPLKLAYRLEVEIASTAGFTWRATNIVDKTSLSASIGRELIGL